MGCHTWFSRPLTNNEFELMKTYAPVEIYDLLGDSEENIKNGMYNKILYDLLMKSYNENIPCVYGQYWWQLGYGGHNPELVYGEQNFIHEIRGENGLFIDVMDFFDIFRIKNYPRKVIHNRRELRKWMRKRYFDLEDWQLDKISRFFQEYPGGVIHFG